MTYDVLYGLFFRHPDKNKDPKAEDMFIKVSKSYEVSENSSSQHFIQALADIQYVFYVAYSVSYTFWIMVFTGSH